MKELMPLDKFKAIMDLLLQFQAKRDRVSDFFEKELMTESWCLFTYGEDVENVLVSLLADEFDCWYSYYEDIKEFDWWRTEHHYGMENEIENWLYSLNEDEKIVEVNGKEIDISSIESLYDYLVSQYNEKHNLTDSKI